MNRYAALYNGKATTVEAGSSYEAFQKAVEHFKPPKSKQHLVSVHLTEKAGDSVTQVLS